MNRKHVYHIFVTVVVIIILVISIRDKYVDYTLSHEKPAYYITYTVKQGQGIDYIACQYNTPYMSVQMLRAKIQAINNVKSLIYPGDLLVVPIYK